MEALVEVKPEPEVHERCVHQVTPPRGSYHFTNTCESTKETVDEYVRHAQFREANCFVTNCVPCLSRVVPSIEYDLLVESGSAVVKRPQKRLWVGCTVPKVASTAVWTMLQNIALRNLYPVNAFRWHARQQYSFIQGGALLAYLANGTVVHGRRDIEPLAGLLHGGGVFRFAVVRNPYARLYSMYKDKFVETKEAVRQSWLWMTQDERDRFLGKHYPFPLSDLVLRLREQIGAPKLQPRWSKVKHWDPHMRPQTAMCVPWLVQYDLVVPVEHIADAWRCALADMLEGDEDKYIEDALGHVNFNRKAEHDALNASEHARQHTLRELTPEARKAFDYMYDYDLAYAGAVYGMSRDQLYEAFVEQVHI